MPFDDVAIEDEGLDLSGLGGMAPQPPAPASPQRQRRSAIKDFAPLLALLPIAAAKGGRMGVAALLQGFQQSRRQADMDQERQVERQRQQSQEDETRDYRTRALQGQEEQRRITNAASESTRKQAFLRDYTAGFANISTAEELNAYLDLMLPAGQQLGIRGDVLRSYAQQVLAPSKVQQRNAEKYLDRLKQQHGEKWMDAAAATMHTLPGEETPISLEQLMALAGRPKNPNYTPTPKMDSTPPAVGSFEDFIVRKYGTAPTPDQIAEGRKVYMQADDRIIVNTTGIDGLNARMRASIDSLSKGFDSQPVTKKIQVMAEAVTFADQLSDTTSNPADDQALIYAFAKANDPDSVVREGEYATVQKYAQSWAEQFGFNVARIFSNTAFLTPQARRNMKATIRAKFASASPQYRNIRKSYADRINNRTGRKDGDSFLIDYEAAFPSARSDSPNTTQQPASVAPAPSHEKSPQPSPTTGRIGRFTVTVKP